MLTWRPWPSSPPSTKFDVILTVHRVEGFPTPAIFPARATVEVTWRGTKSAVSSLRRRRGERRNITREVSVAGDGDGGVEWDEEFREECGIVFNKGKFRDWEIVLSLLLRGANEGMKNEISNKVGVASLNLAEYASVAEEREVEIIAPLLLPGSTTASGATLYLVLRLLELRTKHESPYKVQRTISYIPPSSPSDGAHSSNKDEPLATGGGSRKVKLFKSLLSNGKARKTCLNFDDSEGHCSRSDEAEHTYAWDIDSIDDDHNVDEEDNDMSNIRKSFNYGSLTSANYLGGSFYLDTTVNQESYDLVYYSHRRSDVDFSYKDDTKPPMSDQPASQILKRRLFSWKKSNLSFRSLKLKGEPLLNKLYGEEGGDDIDFDRRQLISSDEILAMLRQKSIQDLGGNGNFGDDNFAVGSWESKELLSRDSNLKLCTEVFFASIDQRSERAAGESACAVLVAIIADWFQTNQCMMPTKSEFDTLIREGSLEWRKLCENCVIQERFPDKHFDLDTVLEAKIRPICFDSGRSFIGFFSPENSYGNDSFDYLHEAMSFDSIWEEICKTPVKNFKSMLYIISWNDHFFILKVEADAFYIIDTLGERLHEGCNQAYILKFDESTSIHKVPNECDLTSNKVPDSDNPQVQPNNGDMEHKLAQEVDIGNSCIKEELLCKGKDSCKEYIKNFLAAIPIRELQADLKRGLLSSTSVHHRLQIEFHSTKLCNAIEEQSPKFSRTVESDSELSLTTESDPELSSSPKPTTNMLWPVQPAGEFAWPLEPLKEAATTFLFAQAVEVN